MRKNGFVVLAAIVLSVPRLVSAGSPFLIELQTRDKTFRGKLVADTEQRAWLMDRDGRLNVVRLDRVQKHRLVSRQFRKYSAAELRDRLRRKFSPRLEVVASQHYLVCAPKKRARQYAKLFERVYRTFYSYFSVRGFRMSEPAFPLVAIVLPNQRQFAIYSRQDGVTASPGLRGYYLRTSNRVALFQRSSKISAHPISARLTDTIVHEGTHQVAFNTGLHQRIGANPKWVVEGLATVFESPGIRHPSQRGSLGNRVNAGRLKRFRQIAAKRYQRGSLTRLISTDKAFRSNVLDAYAEAWALSFYLIETRPRDYVRFLKTIARRDPTQPYSAAERLADFKKVFGSDQEMFESRFLRYVTRLPSPAKSPLSMRAPPTD